MTQCKTLDEIYAAESAEIINNAVASLKKKLNLFGVAAETTEDLLNWSRKVSAEFDEDGDIAQFCWEGHKMACYTANAAAEELNRIYTGNSDIYDASIDNLLNIAEDAGLTDKVVVCRESAASLLGMSNVVLLGYLDVYTKLEQKELPERIRKVNAEYSDKEIIEYDGFMCTSTVQTLLDMLKSETMTGNQVLYESLAYYYMMHNETFDGIIELMDKQQKNMFDKYKDDAICCYEMG